MPKWSVNFTPSAEHDLKWLDRKDARLIVREVISRLGADPLSESRNLIVLRKNPVAERELRVLGKFRVLFDVDQNEKIVDIVVVGMKKGERLVVRGEEYTAHESDSSN